MRRGTTPILEFSIEDKLGRPFDVSTLVNKGVITFKQGSNIVLEKRLSDCDVEENVISFKLSQEETLKFNAGIDVKVQCRFLDTIETNALATDIKIMSVSDVLNEEVLR